MRIVPALALLVFTGCLGAIEVTDDSTPRPDASTAPMPDAPSPEAVRRLLERWSGCMTLENFKTANMAAAWGSLAASGDGRICSGCHDSGAFGFIATRDEAPFFTAISQHASLLSMYFRVDLPNNKVVVNTFAFQSADQRPSHPRFNVEDNAGMTALRAFHAATEANTACGPSTLID